jgi:hypothetical protein
MRYGSVYRTACPIPRYEQEQRFRCSVNFFRPRSGRRARIKKRHSLNAAVSCVFAQQSFARVGLWARIFLRRCRSLELGTRNRATTDGKDLPGGGTFLLRFDSRGGRNAWIPSERDLRCWTQIALYQFELPCFLASSGMRECPRARLWHCPCSEADDDSHHGEPRASAHASCQCDCIGDVRRHVGLCTGRDGARRTRSGGADGEHDHGFGVRCADTSMRPVREDRRCAPRRQRVSVTSPAPLTSCPKLDRGASSRLLVNRR